MRFAYVDPPYLGLGKYYPEHPDARTWDDPEMYRALIGRLQIDYPDGWALSLSSTTLHPILAMCPPTVRIAAWVKPFASFKPGVRVAYTWEPVIFHGGRQIWSRDALTVRDHLSQVITLQRGLVGAKPEKFCRWVADLLGFDADRDTMVDLFPGTEVMGRTLAQGVLA